METPVQSPEAVMQGSELGDEHDLNAEILSQLAPANKEQPVYIDDLEDAVEIDVPNRMAVFKPQPGQQVVIEKWSDGRWMGTSLYTVRSVDVKTGNVMLHDDANMQAAMTNYVTGVLKYGWRFKLPIPGLRLDKREPPKVTAPKVVQPLNADGTKHRGRPKGSKNRSPEQIRADNAAKVAAKLAK